MQIPGEDFTRGRAVSAAGKNYCTKCKVKAPADAQPVAAGRVATTTPKPLTRGPGPGHSTPHPPMRRPSDPLRPSTRTMVPVAPQKSKAPLIIILGILCLGAVGGLIYAVTRKADNGKKNTPAPPGPNTPTPPSVPGTNPPPSTIRPGEIAAKAIKDCWAECKAGKHGPKTCKALYDSKLSEIQRTAFEQEIDHVGKEIAAAVNEENAGENVNVELTRIESIARDMNPATFGSLKNALDAAYGHCGDFANLRKRVDAKKLEIGRSIGDGLANRGKDELAKADQLVREGSKYGALDVINEFLGGLASVEELFPLPSGLKEQFQKKALEIEELIKKDEDNPHVKPPKPPDPDPEPDKLPDDPVPAAGKWATLFNGKDLKGWAETLKGGATWTVEDGAIVGTGPGGAPDANNVGGLLVSACAGFENFELELDMEIAEGIGIIMVRGSEPKGGTVPGIGLPVNKNDRTTVFLKIDKGEIKIDVKGGPSINQKLSEIKGDVPERGRVMFGVSRGSTVKIYSVKIKPLAK